jgi:hypothetical protein
MAGGDRDLARQSVAGKLLGFGSTDTEVRRRMRKSGLQGDLFAAGEAASGLLQHLAARKPTAGMSRAFP